MVIDERCRGGRDGGNSFVCDDPESKARRACHATASPSPSNVRTAPPLPLTARGPHSDRRRILQFGLTLGLAATFAGTLYRVGPAAAQEAREAAGQNVLWISASNSPPYVTPQRTGFEDRLFTEVFRRLGIEVRIYDVPAQRGLELLDAGQDDGTLARNPGMAQRYPNMVQFTEKALERQYMVFTKRTDIKVNGWDSLAGYSVGIVNGWKILERNITKAGSLKKVRDGGQLFRLLAGDRVDLVVFNRWGGQYLLRELDIHGVKALTPPLARREVFFYLHKRHAALVPQASAMLREMKRDGSYQRLVEEILGPLTS